MPLSSWWTMLECRQSLSNPPTSRRMHETTTAAECHKIQVGAMAYLELCDGTLQERDMFLSALEQELGWTRVDILNLQIRVAEILLDERCRRAGLGNLS